MADPREPNGRDPSELAGLMGPSRGCWSGGAERKELIQGGRAEESWFEGAECKGLIRVGWSDGAQPRGVVQGGQSKGFGP